VTTRTKRKSVNGCPNKCGFLLKQLLCVPNLNRNNRADHQQYHCKTRILRPKDCMYNRILLRLHGTRLKACGMQVEARTLTPLNCRTLA
jgi:hypothetical protein